MHIYTLKTALEGEKAILNGRLLLCKINKGDNRMMIVDAITKEELWLTTNVVINLRMSDGVHIATSSGSVYDFIDVENLIPTHTIPVSAVADPMDDFTVINCEHDSRPVHYGDGYDRYQFEFSRDITEAEFRAFLKQENLRVSRQEFQYQDYSELSGSGNKWTYKWIRGYTD